MLEVILSIILAPVALVAAIVLLAAGIGFVKSLTKRRK